MSGSGDHNVPRRSGRESSSPRDAASSAAAAPANGTVDRQSTQYQHPDPRQSSLNQRVNGNQDPRHVQQAMHYPFLNNTHQMLGQQGPHAQQGSQTYGTGAAQGVAASPAAPQQLAAATNPTQTGAPAPRPPRYAMMPEGFRPDPISTPGYQIVDHRQQVPKMEDAGRRHSRPPRPEDRDTPVKITANSNTGLKSGMFWFGFFDTSRPTVPVTKCRIRVARGRGSEGRGSTHAWPNQPSSSDPLPAGLSLSEICLRFPNHVWGDMLRLFISEGWEARRIYDNFPEQVRTECEKDADSKKSHSGRPHNFLQAAIGREIDVMANEDHIYRRILPNPAKGHKRNRPAPGDSNQPATTDGGAGGDGGDDFDDDEHTDRKRQRSGTPHGSQQSGRSSSDSRVQQSNSGSSFAGFGPLPGRQGAGSRSPQSLSPSGQMQSLHPPQPWMAQPAPASWMHQLQSPFPRQITRHSHPDVRSPVNHDGDGLSNHPMKALSQQQLSPLFPSVQNTRYQQSPSFGLMAGPSSQRTAGSVPQMLTPSLAEIYSAQFDEQLRRQPVNAGPPVPPFAQQQTTSTYHPRSSNGAPQMRMPGSTTPDQPEKEDGKSRFEYPGV